MTHTAVPAPVRLFRPPPSAMARVVRAESAMMRQVAEHERHRLARELHDGAIQEVLAAGLAIDLCLTEVLAGSPVRARLEHAKRLTAAAMRPVRCGRRCRACERARMPLT